MQVDVADRIALKQRRLVAADTFPGAGEVLAQRGHLVFQADYIFGGLLAVTLGPRQAGLVGHDAVGDGGGEMSAGKQLAASASCADQQKNKHQVQKYGHEL